MLGDKQAFSYSDELMTFEKDLKSAVEAYLDVHGQASSTEAAIAELQTLKQEMSTRVEVEELVKIREYLGIKDKRPPEAYFKEVKDKKGQMAVCLEALEEAYPDEDVQFDYYDDNPKSLKLIQESNLQGITCFVVNGDSYIDNYTHYLKDYFEPGLGNDSLIKLMLLEREIAGEHIAVLEKKGPNSLGQEEIRVHRKALLEVAQELASEQSILLRYRDKKGESPQEKLEASVEIARLDAIKKQLKTEITELQSDCLPASYCRETLAFRKNELSEAIKALNKTLGRAALPSLERESGRAKVRVLMLTESLVKSQLKQLCFLSEKPAIAQKEHLKVDSYIREKTKELAILEEGVELADKFLPHFMRCTKTYFEGGFFGGPTRTDKLAALLKVQKFLRGEVVLGLNVGEKLALKDRALSREFQSEDVSSDINRSITLFLSQDESKALKGSYIVSLSAHQIRLLRIKIYRDIKKADVETVSLDKPKALKANHRNKLSATDKVISFLDGEMDVAGFSAEEHKAISEKGRLKTFVDDNREALLPLLSAGPNECATFIPAEDREPLQPRHGPQSMI
jgi:hypothetical protein